MSKIKVGNNNYSSVGVRGATPEVAPVDIAAKLLRPPVFQGKGGIRHHTVKGLQAAPPEIIRASQCVVLRQGVLFRGGKEGEIRKQLVESDKLEGVITLTGGVFYSTGVSACILFLNNNKSAEHRRKVCLIDASGIYTPQRAQNVICSSSMVIRLFTDVPSLQQKLFHLFLGPEHRQKGLPD